MTAGPQLQDLIEDAIDSKLAARPGPLAEALTSSAAAGIITEAELRKAAGLEHRHS